MKYYYWRNPGITVGISHDNPAYLGFELVKTTKTWQGLTVQWFKHPDGRTARYTPNSPLYTVFCKNCEDGNKLYKFTANAK